jgi:fumarate reductase (CoM/CoB) subunit B
MAEKKVTLKVVRYNPKTDIQPRYETYEVPLNPPMRLLDALEYIRKEYDGSLAFNSSCRFMTCGTCAVLLDGKHVLACGTLIKEGIHVVEPLPNLPVMKDLVVSFKEVDSHMTKLRPFLERIRIPSETPEVLPPKEFENYESIARCITCSQCLSVCPVSGAVPRDFSGPLYQLKLAMNAFDPRDEGDRLRTAYFEGLFKCTLCGACTEICPKGIDLSEMIMSLRTMSVKQGVGPLEAHRQAMENALAKGFVLENPLATQREILPEKSEPASRAPIGRVALFLGCYIRRHPRLRNWGKTAVDILARNNIEVLIPREQVCCGRPMIFSGQLNERVKEDLVAKNVQIFERLEVDTVLTLCPACGIALTKNYPAILGRSLRFEVMDLTKFLAERSKLNMKDLVPVKMRVTYHDPCDLRRYLNVHEEPRKLIRSLPGIDFVEMKAPGQCCGAGSGLKDAAPAEAFSVAMKKIDMIVDTGAEAVVTECPSCVLHLSRSLGKTGHNKVSVLTVPELISKAFSKP